MVEKLSYNCVRRGGLSCVFLIACVVLCDNVKVYIYLDLRAPGGARGCTYSP